MPNLNKRLRQTEGADQIMKSDDKNQHSEGEKDTKIRRTSASQEHQATDLNRACQS